MSIFVKSNICCLRAAVGLKRIFLGGGWDVVEGGELDLALMIASVWVWDAILGVRGEEERHMADSTNLDINDSTTSRHVIEDILQLHGFMRGPRFYCMKSKWLGSINPSERPLSPVDQCDRCL
jgi:hypothetical protein